MGLLRSPPLELTAMQKPSTQMVILVSQLLLDLQNPRLPDGKQNQQEAIRSMLRAQKDKIVALATHLVEHGPNPSTLPIVMPASGHKDMYEVLDGNRRITACKLLGAPALAEGILDGAKLKRLKHLAVRFERDPIVELRCIVVADREEADTWIQLIHRGQKEGAGLVEWDGQVAARYDARKGSKPFPLIVLDYVREHAQLSEETRKRIDEGKFPVTNLERLVKTPYVRKKLGVEESQGTLVTTYPEEEVLKGLTNVVEDLGSSRVTVSNIKSQEQRINYINSLSDKDLPDAKSILAAPRPIGVPPTPTNPKTGTVIRQRQHAPTRDRTTLIPREFKPNISQLRIGKLLGELKRLNVDDYPNAAAVMFRVFIELSIDHFLEHKLSWQQQKISNTFLSDKLISVTNYFEKNNVMTRAELAPIKLAAGGQTLLVASVKTLHYYVHSRHFSPVPSHLKIAWDDLQPLVEKLWE